ncbi:MAG: serine/threonine-protein phosphatase, partial [Deltaproteobacteria bacterium]|nr:serine/threonine-protein phosphatase [Deltaproteobacteria bacterium]
LEQKVKERTIELRESNQKLADSLEELTNTRLKLAEAQRDAMQKEMILAREIQESILPPRDLVQAKGHAFCGLVIPASYCGGDFWGHRNYSGDRTLLVVADVTGHGVAASLITAVTRSCLDTLESTGTDHAVEDVLAMLSSVVRRSAQGRLLATAFACLVDPEARTLTYANAGSRLPYLVSPGGGRPGALTGTGLRLGEDEAPRYMAQVKSYGAGDRLLLYTDGIIECKNSSGEMYGDRRFRRSLQALARESAPDLIGKLIQEVEAYCGEIERDDDWTLVAVQLD